MTTPTVAPLFPTRSSLIVGVSVLLGIIDDYFFYDEAMGVEFPIFVGLLLAGLGILAARAKRPVPQAVAWLIVPLAFFSVMVFVRASIFVTLLNVGICAVLLLLIVEAMIGKKLRDYVPTKYLELLVLPFRFVTPLVRTLADLLAFRKSEHHASTRSQVIKGLALAIPIVLFLLTLLASADLVFQKYLSHVTDLVLDAETVARIFHFLVVTAALIGAYAYIFRKHDHAEHAQSPHASSYVLGKIETGILLGSVCVLFLVFLIVQAAYLFGGSEMIATLGITYAEYARKGFFELIVVAVFSFLLLWGTDAFTAKTSTGSHGMLFRILGSAVVVEVILIMVSAFKRLALYESAYGFTSMRFYSHAFIIWLAVVFAILLYKMHGDRTSSTFAFHAFLSVLVFVAGINIVNPHAFIARQNIAGWVGSGELDGVYLSQLSDDAIPVIMRAYDRMSAEERQSVAWFLSDRYDRIEEINKKDGWKSFHVARRAARESMSSEINDIKSSRPAQPVRSLFWD